ncbi:MAG: hypothetical protein ACLRZ7_01540 [Lachnospiraceae bacterium]
MQNLKKPKKFTTISFVLIYMFCLALVLIRWAHTFNNDIVVINQEINSHITNFTLSILMCILFGYISLIAGKQYQSCLMIGVLIIVGNFIYETILPLLNTIDIIDAIYGLVGVLFSLIYLYFISKYGFLDKK